MLGSSQSISGPNVALNTIMAEQLRQFADRLEQAEHFDKTLHELVREVFTNHQRIIFSGNGYSEDWKQEAAQRGLSNLVSTADALPAYIAPKNVELFTSHGIFTETEMRARHAIHLEAYNKHVAIEARTMLDMAQHQILPAAIHYCRALCDAVGTKQHVGASHRAESKLIAQLSGHTDSLYDTVEALSDAMSCVPKDAEAASVYYRNAVIPVMEQMRRHADVLESLTDKNYWPYPTYSDLLFY
jgi:glutamine synthetase